MNFTPDYLVVARDSSDSQSTNFVNRVVLRRNDHARPIFRRSHRRTFRYFFGLSISLLLGAIRKGRPLQARDAWLHRTRIVKELGFRPFEHGFAPRSARDQRANIQVAFVRDRTAALLGCCLSLKEIRSWRRGGAEEDRTPDPLRARQVLSQLSYGPVTFGLLGHTTRRS